ncbi:evolutionarily conserved C-terminal region 10 [Raphanus sativus]|uniref:YTH domain-containing family protein n=1 Tax=Raphanus sativus TaxID=3726 RepID=A0A9W3CN72_RAPSA|nr:YTH domain-containing protein ECT2-like [Raphanus sativus]KAJ4871910.1 evolutionarily conserved C-terminal region 10 [Raphanus sativus]
MDDPPASSRHQRNQIVSSGERPPVMPDNGVVHQQIYSGDERIVSSSFSVGSSLYYNVLQNHTNLYPYDWNAAGYVQSINTWDGYPPLYATSPEALHLPQVVYNEDSSLMYQPGFTFYPYPFMMLDDQIPISPAYYPQFGAPSAMHSTHSETGGDNFCFDPTSAYMITFDGYGGGNLSASQGTNSLTYYPQTLGILGPYDRNASSQLHGNGIASSSSLGGYHNVGSYQNPSSIASCCGADSSVRSASDIGKRREKEYSSVSTTISDLFGIRGPRSSSSRVNSKNGTRLTSSAGDSGPNPSLYNHPDFVTDYKNARFFIVKSFSEDNVHRSVKYNVWASTPHGNKKLDTVYRDAEKMGGKKCPIFLFFSVNASGQFCGVAEMVGPVDFEKDAGYWQQGRWSGQFPVKWHILKDLTNNRFSHILLQNNDNKPVTHSRDSQEVKLRQGIEMLRIFKEYEARTSILDDFDYYDEREIQKRVGEDDGGSKEETTSSVEQLSERLQAVTVEDGKEVEKGVLKEKS